MIEIIQVWDLFTTQNFDFEFMEMEKLDCFKKIQDEYEYIFRESEKKGRCNDASVGVLNSPLGSILIIQLLSSHVYLGLQLFSASLIVSLAKIIAKVLDPNS